MEWTVDRETRPWVLRATSQGLDQQQVEWFPNTDYHFFLPFWSPWQFSYETRINGAEPHLISFIRVISIKFGRVTGVRGQRSQNGGKKTFHRQRTILISKIISLYLWQFQKHTLWRHTWNKAFCWFLTLDKAQRRFCSFSVLLPPWSAIYRKINELLLHLVHMQRCIMYCTELARFLVFQNKAIITSIAKDGVMLWVIIVSSIANTIFLITQCKSEFVYTDSKFTSKGKTPRITKTIFKSNRKGDLSLTDRGSL